jgi:hypothetical protein
MSNETRGVRIFWRPPQGLSEELGAVTYQVIYYDDLSSPGVVWKDVTSTESWADLNELAYDRTYTVHVRVVAVRKYVVEGPLSKPAVTFEYRPGSDSCNGYKSFLGLEPDDKPVTSNSDSSVPLPGKADQDKQSYGESVTRSCNLPSFFFF